MTTRINLISGPRNISTAMMYSFRSRRDTVVVDEPLYAHYLRVHPEVDHPGREETLASMSPDGEEVIRDVILGRYDAPVLFIKNMGHHVGGVGLDLDWLSDVTNVFLIRSPAEMLTSYAKNLSHITPEMTGMPQQLEILERILSDGGSPIVLESKQVLINPAAVLEEMCARIGIPWDPAMLSWEAGPKPEDGVWEKYWYHRLHQSTGFEPYTPKDDRVPDSLLPTLEILESCYSRLRPHAIEASAV